MYLYPTQYTLEDRIVASFHNVPLLPYLTECREKGRADVDEQHRKNAANYYEKFADWQSIGRNYSTEISKALKLATDFLWAEHFLSHNDEPKYVSYVNLKILDRYIQVGKQVPVDSILARCRSAIALLVRDWLDYEEHGAFNSKMGKYNRQIFKPDLVDNRIAALKELKLLTPFVSDLPAIHSLDETPSHSYPNDWIYYANAGNGAFALVHMTGLPQSTYHDEYMFLRTIHISECCFWGIISSIKIAIDQFSSGNISASAKYLNEASGFSSILVKLFAVFSTMPYESFFDGFRIKTGDASAIQSRKYQAMDALLRSFNEEKASALRKNPEVQDIVKIAENSSVNIIKVAKLCAEMNVQPELRDAIGRIDRDMLAWRSKHLGIARRYLPREAQGTGDEGIPYLESNVRDPKIMDTTSFFPSEDERITFTSAIQVSANNCSFAFMEFTNFDVRMAEQHLNSTQRKLSSDFKKNRDEIEPRINLYNSFFQERGHICPLVGQFSKGMPSKKIPIIPRLLLSLELQTGLLMGIHDLKKIGSVPIFDIASSGENYRRIDGKQVSCRDRDWVLRDNKGIFASYFTGPDKRTSLNIVERAEATQFDKVALLIFGAPGISENEVTSGIDTLKAVISNFANLENESIWSF